MKTLLPRLLCGPLLLLAASWSICQVSAQTSADKEKEKKNPLVQEAEDLFKKGDVDAAYKKLEKAYEKDSTLTTPRLTMARWLLANQQTVQAGRTLLEIAAMETPDNPEVYLTNGSLALAEGRVTDTLLNCRIALQFAEGSRWSPAQRRTFQKEARAGLATAFEARKDWQEAKSHLIGWLDLDPENAQVRQRLARALFLTGQESAAIAELTTATKADSKLEPPEVTMALLYASQEAPKDSAKKDDNSKKDYAEKAKEFFEKAIKKYPEKPRVHQAYAGWLLDTGNRTAAKMHIGEAQKLEKDSPSRETLALLGLQARYQGNLTEAEKYLEQVIRLYPSDFFSSNQLALVLIESPEKEKQQRALEYATNNAARYQRSAEALATLGWVYYKSGKLEEAEKALALATNSGQASADTAYYMSKVLFDKGKFKEALEVLKKALDSKGVFVNRTAADEFLPRVKEKAPPEDKKKDEKEKDKDKKDKQPKP